ncbi:MAG: oligosaccharide flippase family protein [Bacteroidales bacterium]|jgi:O-antigen/teichoic acid export membrane protein|nr:oligosaccharide flippase family protein [Bacteroidales bacterium]MDD2205492.1 oligosaccharide flippase family protein [Bacteroidales bacterium]MDD3914929.1 oligosaccharide flippase family protein [Bacteroidales bacterium]MDD4634781.1 oligosaccharide flippase family protein [Bacteroidales bacterium]
MGRLKKLAGQTIVYGGTTIVGRLLNYLLVPFHTYIFLNPQSYGVVGEMYAWSALLLVILTYGMETAYFRYMRSDTAEENRKKVFSTSMLSLITTSVLFIILGLTFSQQIANLLKYPDNPEYVRWFVIIAGLDAICSIPFARLRNENRALRFATIKITNILINIFFNIFFLWFCPLMIKNGVGTSFFSAIYKPEIGVGYIFIANLIASCCQFVLLIFSVKFGKLYFDNNLLKKMLKYAFPLLILGLAGVVNESLDRILVKNLSSPDTNIAMHNLGVYSACFKISVIMTLFIQAFRYSAEPFFFSIYKDKDAKEGYAVVMTYFVIVCTIIFLGTMLYIDYIKYFVSKPYHEGLIIVPFLLLANMMLGIVYNLSIWYKMNDKTKYGAYITIGGAVITLILNFILLPRIGYLGAAITHFCTYLFMMLASYFLGQKYYPVPYNLKKIGFYCLLSIILFIISYFLIPFDKFGSHEAVFKIIINTIILGFYLLIIYKKEFRTVKSLSKTM